MGTRRRRRGGPAKVDVPVAPTNVATARSADPPKVETAAPASPDPTLDIKGVEALAGALNKSAERLQTLWFTFLSVTLYFVISAGTTTHRMLFLQEGQTLPIINVKLPLLGFYVVAPTFYVVFHAYFLMMLVMLARTAKAFEDALVVAVADEAARERFRMRVENALFLQIIIGARRERTGWNGVWLRAIALITLALAPVMLLVMFQLMFLPYHHDWITWWHRALVVVDLVLIWTLWPAYMLEWGERLLPRWEPSGRMAVKALATVLVLVFSLAMATYPGERIHANQVAGWIDDVGRWGLQKAGWQLPTGSEKFSPGTPDEVLARLKYNAGRISALLFGWDLPAGNLTPDRHGWFPNRLWLPNENFVADEKLNKLPAEHLRGCPTHQSYSLSLATRDLTGAVLIGANLKQADFMGAVVTGANFDVANLENARFEVRAGASARFFKTQLQGASLFKAELPGAFFQGAHMQGACLLATKLQGAWLEGADLQGASLEMATLQGASLNGAKLQGASLEGAELQGASLGRAKLEGSSLIGTELQGASLWESDLRGASLYRAQVWRTQFKPSSFDAVDVRKLRHEPVVCTENLNTDVVMMKAAEERA